jgi:AraC-like DNA-binding protein
VTFGAKTTELVIEARALELPVATARPGLAAILDLYMRDLLARLPTPDVFARRVHDAIARSIHGGRPSLATTARQLHVSRRTLQRHLQQVGLSHRDLVDEVRRDLAERLLATPRLSIAEIAYLLGFENASGFQKAYKRWHGVAPSRRRTRR